MILSAKHEDTTIYSGVSSQSKNIELENENIKLMKEKSEISRRKFNELYKKR